MWPEHGDWLNPLHPALENAIPHPQRCVSLGSYFDRTKPRCVVALGDTHTGSYFIVEAENWDTMPQSIVSQPAAWRGLNLVRIGLDHRCPFVRGVYARAHTPSAEVARRRTPLPPQHEQAQRLSSNVAFARFGKSSPLWLSAFDEAQQLYVAPSIPPRDVEPPSVVWA